MSVLTTYTSPWGVTYDVVPENLSYVDYHEFGNPKSAYVQEYTQYNFYQKGKFVTFTLCLDEQYLAETFGVIEGAYAAPVGSRFD